MTDGGMGSKNAFFVVTYFMDSPHPVDPMANDSHLYDETKWNTCDLRNLINMGLVSRTTLLQFDHKVCRHMPRYKLFINIIRYC